MTAANDEQYSDAPKLGSQSFLKTGVETVTPPLIFWIRRFCGRTSGGRVLVEHAVSKGFERIQCVVKDLIFLHSDRWRPQKALLWGRELPLRPNQFARYLVAVGFEQCSLIESTPALTGVRRSAHRSLFHT
jgi:hypothetical protein